MLLPPDASDSQILDAVRAWADALAAEDYAGALAMVDARPDWTPELLRIVIGNYGSIEPMRDGSTYRVTPLGSARGGPAPRHRVDRDGDHVSVWFDLPLNINITRVASDPEIAALVAPFEERHHLKMRFYDVQPVGRAR